MSEATFEWDSKKELENIAKHGVSFFTAQYAFADKHRVIAKDLRTAHQKSVTSALASPETAYSR